MAEENKTQKEVAKPSGKPLFFWRSPEFMRHERNRMWFLYVIGATILLVVIFLLLKQWSGAILAFVAGIVFTTLSGAHPKTVECAIYKEGVVVDGKAYNFNQFKSFWESGADFQKITFQLSGKFGGIVVMPMKDENIEQIRLYLSKFLPEEPAREDMVDMINRLFKF